MAVGQEMQISEDFARVLQISHDVWQRSGGAFDPTIGPLVDLWGFGPTVTDNTAPSTQQLSLAVRNIGFQHLILDDLSLSKTRPVQLDLSAVAKGYAVDLVADMLEMLGLPDYLVEIGGEIRASGSNPNGQIWRVAIEEPALISSVNRVIPVAESAVATSGDYRNYFEQEGIRYSHILDPRSGSPIKHNLASVTVLSNSCAEADAWATAFLVMGAEPGLQLAEQLKLPVYLLTKEGDTFKVANSEAFEPLLLLPTDQVAL
jgi:thiamine biosynthesis lipoprotein